MSTRTIETPSVASVAAGIHPTGDTVTITGIVNGRTNKRTTNGRRWAMFELIDGRTAVEIIVSPDVLKDAAELLEPKDTAFRAPVVKVTGHVDCRDVRPVLFVEQVAPVIDGEPLSSRSNWTGAA